MGVINYLDDPSQGPTVGGMKDTVQALNERRVQRLIVCANLMPSAGWQCHDCLALHVDTDAQPQKCVYCDSLKIQRVELKGGMIAQAYRHGCSIEIMSRCPELERVGGVSARLRERGSNRPS